MTHNEEITRIRVTFTDPSGHVYETIVRNFEDWHPVHRPRQHEVLERAARKVFGRGAIYSYITEPVILFRRRPQITLDSVNVKAV